MATQVASIGVGKLSSSSKYVDHFLVEIYSDSGHTNKIGQATSTAQYDSTTATWKQKDYISFPGLVFGTTYFLRAYTVAPLSGALSAPTDFSTAAGSASAPGCTYPGTFTATLSGIGYVITPGSVPSDIDHFEAVWTVNDATVPSSTTMPYWTGQTTNGSIAFFAGGKPNDVIRAYVRAVNTSQQAQAWQAVGSSITISTVFGGAYTGTLNDGTLLGNGGPGVFSGSTGRLGIGGTQTADNLTLMGSAAGVATISAASPYWQFNDTTGGGNQYYFRSTGGSQVVGQTGVSGRTFLNSSGQYSVNGSAIADYMIASIGSTSGAPGRMGMQGTDAMFDLNGTAAPRNYGLYNTSGTLTDYDFTAGQPRVNLSSSGGFGIGASPGSDFYFTNSNRSYFQGSGPGVNLVDTQVGGRQYMALSGSGLAAGYTIYNGTNANYPLMIDNSANIGLGAVTPGTYTVRSTGEIFSGAGTNPAFSFADRSTGAITSLYGSSGYPRLFQGSADFATFNPSTGAMGLGGTYTGDWISIQGTPVIASDKNLYNQIAVSGKSRNLSDVTDLSNGAVGQNLMENPGFELPANPGTGDLVAGWYNFNSGNGGSAWSMSVDTAATFTPFAGNQSIKISLGNSYSIAAGAFIEGAFGPRRLVLNPKPGQKYWTRVKFRTDQNTVLPTGLDSYFQVTCAVKYSDNSFDFFVATNGTGAIHGITSAWKDAWGTLTVPTPTGKTVISLQFYVDPTVQNTTGSPISTPASGQAYDVRVDNIEIIRVADTGSDEVAKVGSMAPALYGSMSYTSTSSSITWSWSLNILRTDVALSTVSLSGSQAVTGLSNNTTYQFYPFYDEGTLTGTPGINMVSTGGVGSPSWAHTSAAQSLTQEQNRSDHVALSTSPMAGATATSGGTGSGGGSGVCLAAGLYVKECTRGVILIEHVKVGDYLWSKDAWMKVRRVSVQPDDVWIDVTFNCEQCIPCTPGHRWPLRSGVMKPAHELCLVDELFCSTGITSPDRLAVTRKLRDKVSIELEEEPHTFYVCSHPDKPWVLTHNVSLPC